MPAIESTPTADLPVSAMTVEQAVVYINNYPTADHTWIQHRVHPEIEIEEQYPHRIRYVKHLKNGRTAIHIRKLTHGGSG